MKMIYLVVWHGTDGEPIALANATSLNYAHKLAKARGGAAEYKVYRVKAEGFTLLARVKMGE